MIRRKNSWHSQKCKFSVSFLFRHLRNFAPDFQKWVKQPSWIYSLTWGFSVVWDCTSSHFYIGQFNLVYASVNGYSAKGSEGNCRVLSPCRLFYVQWLNTPQGVEKVQIEQACQGMKCKVPLGLHTCDRRERYIKFRSFHFILSQVSVYVKLTTSRLPSWRKQMCVGLPLPLNIDTQMNQAHDVMDIPKFINHAPKSMVEMAKKIAEITQVVLGIIVAMWYHLIPHGVLAWEWSTNSFDRCLTHCYMTQLI